MHVFERMMYVFINLLIGFIMKKLTDEQKARINHATTTVVAGLLFVLCVMKDRHVLAFACFCLFFLGILLYNNIEK